MDFGSKYVFVKREEEEEEEVLDDAEVSTGLDNLKIEIQADSSEDGEVGLRHRILKWFK